MTENNNDFRKLVQAEEAKRNRMISPARRWQMIQDAITFVEQKVRRNQPAHCLREQQQKLKK